MKENDATLESIGAVEVQDKTLKLEVMKYKKILNNVWLNVCQYYGYSVEDGNKLVGKLKKSDKKVDGNGDELIQENKEAQGEEAPKLDNFDVINDLEKSESQESDREGQGEGESKKDGKKKRKGKKKTAAAKNEVGTGEGQGQRPPGGPMEFVMSLGGMVWQIAKTFFLFQAAYMVLTYLGR